MGPFPQQVAQGTLGNVCNQGTESTKTCNFLKFQIPQIPVVKAYLIGAWNLLKQFSLMKNEMMYPFLNEEQGLNICLLTT